MQYLFLLLLCVVAITAETKTCTNPRVRKSWLTLKNSEKLEYIRAIKCLIDLPAKNNYSAARTRRDDWTAMHILRARPWKPGHTVEDGPASFEIEPPGIHFNGIFLPWHRYFLWTYETALIEECGYKGAQPYYDWTIYTSKNNLRFADSPLFDPVYGFGGNGEAGSLPNSSYFNPIGSCLREGPFANMTVTLGMGYNLNANPRCFKRNFFVLPANDTLVGPEMVDDVMKQKDYFTMLSSMSATPQFSNPPRYGVHSVGHVGIGADGQDFHSSPNDPIFYLHHANLDRVWDLWQQLLPENLYAINGPTSMGKAGARGPGNTTLDDMLLMSPDIAPDLPARAFMDPLNRDGKGICCFRYE